MHELVESRETGFAPLIDQHLRIKINGNQYVRQRVVALTHLFTTTVNKTSVIHPAYTAMRITNADGVRKRDEKVRERKRRKERVTSRCFDQTAFVLSSTERASQLLSKHTNIRYEKNAPTNGGSRRKLELRGEGNGESSG